MQEQDILVCVQERDILACVQERDILAGVQLRDILAGVQLRDILAGVQVCVLTWNLILDRPVPCQCKHGFKFRIDGNNKVYLNVSTFGRYPYGILMVGL